MSETPSLPPTTKPLDADAGRALVEAWRTSGLSGAAFCRTHNLRVQRLDYWRERLGYPLRVVGEAQRVAAEQPPTAAGFVQVVMGDAPSPATTHVDIVVGGAVVRVCSGFDAGLLRAVVGALRSET